MRLDRIVTIMAQSGAKNAMNEPTNAWAEVFTTRAKVNPAPGTEKYANDQNTATAPMLFMMRSEERTRNLSPKYKLRMDGVDYGVVSVIQEKRGGLVEVAAVARR